MGLLLAVPCWDLLPHRNSCPPPPPISLSLCPSSSSPRMEFDGPVPSVLSRPLTRAHTSCLAHVLTPHAARHPVSYPQNKITWSLSRFPDLLPDFQMLDSPPPSGCLGHRRLSRPPVICHPEYPLPSPVIVQSSSPLIIPGLCSSLSSSAAESLPMLDHLPLRTFS